MSRQPRKRTRRGVYRRCRRGFLGLTACPGYYLSKSGFEIRHARCGGDGWIKVGAQGSGRGRRRPGRGTGRHRRRAARAIGGASLVWFGLGDMLGTVGYVLAAVILVAAVALKLLGATVRLANR